MATKQTLRTRLAAAEAKACDKTATQEDRAAAEAIYKTLCRGGK